MNTKSIDLTNMSEDGEYAIAFAARKITGVLDVGHAFIVWYELTNTGKRYVHRASGFYPSDGKLKLVVADSGELIDDSETDIDKQLIVKISSPSFQRALGVEAHYASGSWVLGINDCVTFIQKVGEEITGLSLPARIDGITPGAYISGLWDSN